jgi:hypothetical protein
MTPTFLISALIRCIFLSKGLASENKVLGSRRSGCKQPKWWFSATVFSIVLCSQSLAQQQPVRPTFEGDVKSASNKELYVVLDGGNALKFRVNGKTIFYDRDQKIKASDLHSGQHVAVEAQFELDGSYNAVIVRLKAATPTTLANP